jgi:hypothetical protein
MIGFGENTKYTSTGTKGLIRNLIEQVDLMSDLSRFSPSYTYEDHSDDKSVEK